MMIIKSKLSSVRLDDHVIATVNSESWVTEGWTCFPSKPLSLPIPLLCTETHTYQCETAGGGGGGDGLLLLSSWLQL